MANYGRNGMWTRTTTDVLASFRQRLTTLEARIAPLEALVAERNQLQGVILDLESALATVLAKPEMLSDIGSTIRRKRSYLAGRWSRNHDACVACGLAERPHKSRGRCSTCVERDRVRALRSRANGHAVDAVGVADGR